MLDLWGDCVVKAIRRLHLSLKRQVNKLRRMKICEQMFGSKCTIVKECMTQEPSAKKREVKTA